MEDIRALEDRFTPEEIAEMKSEMKYIGERLNYISDRLKIEREKSEYYERVAKFARDNAFTYADAGLHWFKNNQNLFTKKDQQSEEVEEVK